MTQRQGNINAAIKGAELDSLKVRQGKSLAEAECFA